MEREDDCGEDGEEFHVCLWSDFATEGRIRFFRRIGFTQRVVLLLYISILSERGFTPPVSGRQNSVKNGPGMLILALQKRASWLNSQELS
jgi:hypothetical protein